MFSPSNTKQLQESFNEFCRRPENRRASEAAQAAELKQAIKAKELAAWRLFEAKASAYSILHILISLTPEHIDILTPEHLDPRTS